MTSLLSGIKTQAMAMLPQLIQTAEPQIESAIVRAMQGMTPEKKQLFSSNLNRLNSVVQREVASPAPVTQPESLPPSPSGGKKRKTRKVRKHKKRT
jgi:hypothetical protein